MKSFYFVLIIPIILFSSACSKSNMETVTINVTEAKMQFDEKFSFTTNASNPTWESSDVYVGIIDANGQFEAKHIGETTVTVTSSLGTANAKVVVEPYITGIIEPLFGQAISKGDVKAFENRRLTWETTTSLAYAAGSSKESDVLYLWQDRGVWNGTNLTFASTFSYSEAIKFYSERYIKIFDGTSQSSYQTKDDRTAIRVRINSQGMPEAYYHVR